MMSKHCTKATSCLSVFMPFKHVSNFLRDIMGLEISVTCLQDTVYKIGDTIYQKQLFKGKRPETVDKPKEDPDILYIQADGSMVPIRGENEREFKEVKLGLVYTNSDVVKKKTKNGSEKTEIKNKRFVSSIGEGVEPFKKMLFAQAIEKGYYRAGKVVLLTDGATWISKMKEEYFPEAIHILDWYHAVEHLWKTAHELFGIEDTKRCEEWVNPLKEKLWDEKVNEVIEIIKSEAFSRKNKQKPLFELRGYFAGNREKMLYDVFRERGYYIGSGAIESAHKYIIASRLKQAGMRWSIRNANALIWLRCLYFEDRWDNFWQQMNPKEYLKPFKGRLKRVA